MLNRSLFHVGLFRHLKHVLHFHVRHFQRPWLKYVLRPSLSKFAELKFRLSQK